MASKLILARGIAGRPLAVAAQHAAPTRQLVWAGAASRTLAARWNGRRGFQAGASGGPSSSKQKPAGLPESLGPAETEIWNDMGRAATEAEHSSQKWRDFSARHIGPRDEDIQDMLRQVGVESMDTFISQVIPADVMLPPQKAIHKDAWNDHQITDQFSAWDRANDHKTYLNGGGYYPVEIPPVIKRNIIENPAWYTSYTPYQAEVSQGRLESLLNFQTMVSDLTGLPVANASLLDEGTAAAEAMTMSLNSLPTSRAKRPNKTYVVSHLVNERTLNVMRGRAQGFGINLISLDLSDKSSVEKLTGLGDDLIGVLVQYPDAKGGVQDFKDLADQVHKQGVLLSAATDLSALTFLKPPGEWGADVAFGNSQRFGVPLGFGGPHAAFMAVKESSKRRLPGRIVGVSQDRMGRRSLRLALQTREQHIRREKATSNVCTAQAMLANMAAMYVIFHGPQGLQDMGLWCLRYARMIQELAEHYGFETVSKTPDGANQLLSDIVTVRPTGGADTSKIHSILLQHDVDCSVSSEELTMAIPTTFTHGTFAAVAMALKAGASKNAGDDALKIASAIWKKGLQETNSDVLQSIPQSVRRESAYLTHPVFNSHHSETEMLRYIHHLQSRDLSLVHSMIPLGSCTMKLNGTKQMELIVYDTFSNSHPLADPKRFPGYSGLFEFISRQLTALTGMDDVSLQPNSGAQGEFAGLRVIRRWHEQQPGAKRDICLIPASAHGTNPASAAMAGMRVVPIKCDTATGNLDLEDLESKCKKHADELGAIMVTYPSTFGVFEPHIRKVCDMVHQYGGLVYMDGANMNAQIGITSPGAIGADVCHLNLHKTFCIPHGGGGPGVGPICVKDFLGPFLPGRNNEPHVASADYGSASILPISWAYMTAMGDKGLRKATEVALLNANYLLTRLKEHYPILYTNDTGRCAHEFIIDIRPFTKSAGVEVADVAKRLQDYGFHAPTMSWPVPNTMMIEPTESESKEELDRFVDALVSIREEIRDIEEGKQPREGNVLKMAPHPQVDIILGDGNGKWDRSYSRETAAYPLPYLQEKKFWPVTARANDAYGDTNLFCTCPPVEDTTGSA